MSIGLLEEVVLRRVPKFLRGPNAGRLLKSYAATMDGNVEQLRQGLSFLNPLTCPREMLPALLKDRALPTYPYEPEDGTRARAAHWLDLHRQRGSHQGCMRHAQPYFIGIGTALPTIRIVHQSGSGVATWHTLSAAGKYTKARVSPSNFNYDGQTSKWSRWWAFVYMSGTGIAPPITYGSGHTYGDGSLYGSVGLSPGNLADIPSLFRDWKRAGTRCTGVALVWDASAVDPAGTPTQDADGRWSLPNGANTWAGLVDPGTGKATRPANVQWLYDPGPG